MNTLHHATKGLTLFLVAVFAGLGMFALSTLPVFAGAVIVPGKSAGPYRLGDRMPAQSDKDQSFRHGIKLLGDGTISRIQVTSTRYVLEGSWLRVGEHSKQDVLRFYGKPDEDSKPYTFFYPFNGLEFKIDPKTETIQEITISQPRVRSYRINPDAVKLYKEYYKK